MSIASVETKHIFEAWELRRGRLRLNSGSYGDRERLRLESEEFDFAPGIGLPGKVWSTRAPVLFDQFRVIDFVRAEAARAAGLSAGIGLPVIDGGRFTAALTVLLGSAQSSFVCEIWSPDEFAGLTLRSGFYGRYNHFQGISARVKFPYGQGLPGIVWATKSPQIMENLGTSSAFLRADDARREGLFTGLGIPVATAVGLEVVLLLSSRESPLAKVIEIWKPDGAGMRLAQSACGELHGMRPGSERLRVGAGEGFAGVVRQTRLPLVSENATRLDAFRGRTLTLAGLSEGVGFPILVDGELQAVVVLLN